MQTKLLEKAVQYLYGHGIIKKDKDIADKTEYNKATVSSYLSGKISPSEEFIRKFEKAFRLKLEDFKDGGEHETVAVHDPIQLLSEGILQVKAELQTNRQLMIEVLAAVTNKSVMEVQLLSDKMLSHNLSKILSELKQVQS